MKIACKTKIDLRVTDWTTKTRLRCKIIVSCVYKWKKKRLNMIKNSLSLDLSSLNFMISTFKKQYIKMMRNVKSREKNEICVKNNVNILIGL